MLAEKDIEIKNLQSQIKELEQSCKMEQLNCIKNNLDWQAKLDTNKEK
jgi:hypothetical protein